jgi:hypothetical protein
MQNIISRRDLHFKKNLVSFYAAAPFHVIWIEKLDHGCVLQFFIQENQFFSFFIVLDVFYEQILCLDLCFFFCDLSQFSENNKLFMSSRNNKIVFSYGKKFKGGYKFFVVFKHIKLFKFVVPQFNLSWFWRCCKLLLVAPFYIGYGFFVHVLLFVHVIKVFTEDHSFSFLVNCQQIFSTELYKPYFFIRREYFCASVWKFGIFGWFRIKVWWKHIE